MLKRLVFFIWFFFLNVNYFFKIINILILAFSFFIYLYFLYSFIQSNPEDRPTFDRVIEKLDRCSMTLQPHKKLEQCSKSFPPLFDADVSQARDVTTGATDWTKNDQGCPPISFSADTNTIFECDNLSHNYHELSDHSIDRRCRSYRFDNDVHDEESLDEDFVIINKEDIPESSGMVWIERVVSKETSGEVASDTTAAEDVIIV